MKTHNNKYKKLSCRRETARQLYACLSRLVNWSFTSAVNTKYNDRLAKVVSVKKPSDMRGSVVDEAF